MFPLISPGGAARVVLAAVLAAPAAAPPAPPGRCTAGEHRAVTIAATTDVHGRIRSWDYYQNATEPQRGLTRAATIVDSLRRSAPGSVVLVDAGDLLQGNPFAYVARTSYAARNPIIAAMNAMGYDAAVVGNHEFNYGVPYLDSAVAQARFPFLAANVAHTNRARVPYRASAVVTRGGVRIGIVGATTPGSNVWDASNLAAAHLHVADILPAVQKSVADVRRRGVDLIVVVLHSGLDEPSSYDTVSTEHASENVAARVAREVPGVDLVVYGHSHKQNAGQRIGRTLVVQPKNWATSVADVRAPFRCAAGRWKPDSLTSVLIAAAGHAEAPALVAVTEPVHAATVRYATSAIGTTPDLWRADSARLEPTAITGLIMAVERQAAHADIAATAAFDTSVRLTPGNITIAELAQLYPYENTLRAVRISGQQLRAYLEHSSRYYRQSPSGVPAIDTTVPGYNFDIVSGVDYALDLSRPVGQRVVRLQWHGHDVAPGDSFTMALNNYRQTGGGGYAMLRGAPVVYDREQEIRQLLIDEVRRRQVLRASDFLQHNWSILPPKQTP